MPPVHWAKTAYQSKAAGTSDASNLDWPVCVFVHRIFIFIQFSLFENIRSMMHLTDY